MSGYLLQNTVGNLVTNIPDDLGGMEININTPSRLVLENYG